MKKIISTLLAASLMLLGTQAFAQMSFNAGYLNSTKTIKGAESENSNGAYAGFTYNIPVAGGLAFAPGIYYSLLAGKQTLLDAGTVASAKDTFTEHAVNVPLLLNWGMDLARDSRFFVFAGPTVQYGLSSKVKTDVSSFLGDGSSTYDNYNNRYNNLNRFNVYAGGGIGMQAGAFLVTVGYDYGLMNLSTAENASEIHRSNLKIGVGFAF